VIGHGEHRYRVDVNWSKASSETHPVNNCHEMIQAPDGRLFLVTDHPKNNVLIYTTAGELAGAWTLGMKGAHGLTLQVSNGEPFLWITDTGPW
jgi:hypothetical protein